MSSVPDRYRFQGRRDKTPSEYDAMVVAAKLREDDLKKILYPKKPNCTKR